MAKAQRRKTHKITERPPFDCIALLLQGGGALGAYQCGVYEGLVEAGIMPDWVAGISIGAINAALIAGNAPEHRVERLRQFWQEITTQPMLDWTADFGAALIRGDMARASLNQASASIAMTAGVPGFFAPRFPPAWANPDGTREAISYYETRELKATLERLIDFDRINAGPMRLSIGAVNITSGNFVYFDSETHRIGSEHVMASGALPPGFPPVEIDGQFYWDGGLVTNTPLQWVVESGVRQDTLAFQVDLWNARGSLPRNLAEVETRRKEIQFSSRTRASTDQIKRMQQLRCALATLLEKLPEQLRHSNEVGVLSDVADHKVYSIVHLIYRTQNYEGNSKDYEFSRLSMEEHWRAGLQDAICTLRHPRVLRRPESKDGVATFDFHVDGTE
ncbi:MAG TPA: patatin-like phospholipase family protein [Candidatus Cybelea sp.]|nr:patatin-like phospholipase family protein [Candidatus Cybelea sp.]